jgi:hypothetical protein
MSAFALETLASFSRTGEIPLPLLLRDQRGAEVWSSLGRQATNK